MSIIRTANQNRSLLFKSRINVSLTLNAVIYYMEPSVGTKTIVDASGLGCIPAPKVVEEEACARAKPQ